VPAGPPFALDVLADLHAGVFSDEVAAVLRPRVAADPASAAILAALDATVTDLRSLPPVPIPPQVAARLDAVIAAESAARARAGGPPAGAGAAPAPPIAGPLPMRSTTQQTPSPPSGPFPAQPPPRPAGGTVSSLDHARRTQQSRSTPQRRWATGLAVAAAVAAVFAIGAVVVNSGGTPGTGLAGDLGGITTGAGATTGTDATGRPSGSAGEHEPSGGAQAPAPTTPGQTQAIVADPQHLTDLLPKIAGKAPAGPFADHDRLLACLAANDADHDEVLGVLPVSYTGERAYAISLRASDGTLRILVVGPECGATGADLKAEQTTHG
jgi:hypothetical protein